MATRFNSDPYLSFKFEVDVRAGFIMLMGYFTEVSGITSEIEVIEWKEGGGQPPPAGQPPKPPSQLKRMPGLFKPGELTLKQGLTSDMGFWNWLNSVQSGQEVMGTSMTITLRSPVGLSSVVWQATNVWPSKISGPSLNASSSTVAIEELTIQYEKIERIFSLF